ncbi:hypothetical protein JKP88DRAFT_230862 [Tribonema minus]|uniref:peptidylprolyl isomerase n=1 Tax=Tribonema minus TaxID=303371 RepID=A0A835ZI71_9STRA|nr:hypothetical protein JKP88DRAFT_230862 [Tribonema minus]
MPALRGLDYGKPRAKYPDFVELPSGLQYKDIKVGSGEKPSTGDRVVIDWEGYTIGYYGRPFQLKNSVKGGAFAADTDFLRFTLGDGTVIPALNEALATMKEGGVRQIIVPNEIGYPESDRGHTRVGPKPSTFSGNRALDFVLQNKGIIDKTLLFNVELKRVDKPGQRGFKRGA